ncbi:MAG TPA: SAM-dependent chlorinase/fluorinase [Lacibacter sp.]|nr:SAM-dependent chlorinase/fluorinase [Lacibacter sp.]HMO89112.1 SAM-dependent chlorinase/fluorinase [Lacibacter sp.]HMP87999.1 SAM-dependent chlorinase/fluorinase [Lacibacter sp.]
MTLLTLTSDFGAQDYLAGAVKGTLMAMDPAFQVVDITHSLTPSNDPQAAYVIRNAVRHFPEGTVHLVFVNLFQYVPDHLLLVRHNGQYYCIADNGLITMILEEPPQEVVALPLDASRARNTLHCTEVFGRVIRGIRAGAKLADLGDASVSIQVRNPLRPLTTSQYIEGQIIYIDHFENVVVNITHEEFEAQRRGRRFKIVFRRDEVIDQLRETYADVPEGEKLALFNAAGYLEIAINKGNAAGLFGLQRFSEKNNSQYNQSRLMYQTIRIYFE